jgi:hypothetical protein
MHIFVYACWVGMCSYVWMLVCVHYICIMYVRMYLCVCVTLACMCLCVCLYMLVYVYVPVGYLCVYIRRLFVDWWVLSKQIQYSVVKTSCITSVRREVSNFHSSLFDVSVLTRTHVVWLNFNICVIYINIHVYIVQLRSCPLLLHVSIQVPQFTGTYTRPVRLDYTPLEYQPRRRSEYSYLALGFVPLTISNRM